MVVYSFFSRIVKVVGALNLSKLVCRIQANQTNERNTGTSVKQRKNIFQVRDYVVYFVILCPFSNELERFLSSFCVE